MQIIINVVTEYVLIFIVIIIIIIIIRVLHY